MPKEAAAGITNKTMLFPCLKPFNGLWLCSGAKLISMIYEGCGAWGPLCPPAWSLIIPAHTMQAPSPLLCLMLYYEAWSMFHVVPTLHAWQTPSSVLPSHLMIPYVILLSLVLRLVCFLSSFHHRIRNNRRVAIISVSHCFIPRNLYCACCIISGK